MNIKGKNIIITGAASGIGQELVRELSLYDCSVIAVDLKKNAIETPSTSVTPYACDCSRNEEIDALFDFAVATMGSVDIFIANAGFAYYEKIESADWPHIEKIYNINTFSPIYSAIKMKQINKKRPFAVVVTASAMAHWTLPGYALYGSTKAAIHSFADAYRCELDHNQKLQVVYPIATRTNFFKEAGESPMPLVSQTTKTVAQSVIRGIEREDNAIYPSKLFLFLLLNDRLAPWIKPLVQHLEYHNFKRWLEK